MSKPPTVNDSIWFLHVNHFKCKSLTVSNCIAIPFLKLCTISNVPLFLQMLLTIWKYILHFACRSLPTFPYWLRFFHSFCFFFQNTALIPISESDIFLSFCIFLGDQCQHFYFCIWYIFLCRCSVRNCGLPWHFSSLKVKENLLIKETQHIFQNQFLLYVQLQVAQKYVT